MNRDGIGVKINVAGEDLLLLPERAFFWPAKRTLGLADVHLGKAHSLQRLGIPIPAQAHRDDLDQIGELIDRLKPSNVVILGDFIHRKDSWSDSLIKMIDAFFAKFSDIRWSLVIGNHERGSKPYLTSLPFQIFEESLQIGPLTMAHGHQDSGAGFAIVGHVHPAVSLRSGPTRLRLPCFVLDDKRLLLPSFGSLTGGFELEVTRDQRIFAVTPHEVFEVKGH